MEVVHKFEKLNQLLKRYRDLFDFVYSADMFTVEVYEIVYCGSISVSHHYECVIGAVANLW